MSLEEHKIKRVFFKAGDLDEMLDNSIPFDALSEDERETVFSMFVDLDSVNSDMLAYIAIKTKRKETLERALNHPKVIINWREVIKNINIISEDNKFDVKFIIDNLIKQYEEIIEIDEIKQLEDDYEEYDDYDLFLDVLYNVVIATFRIEIDKDGYCDRLLNIILNYVDKNIDEETLVELSEKKRLGDIGDYSCLGSFIKMVRYISFHPQSSIDTSNRAISIMEKIEELCKNIDEINEKDKSLSVVAKSKEIFLSLLSGSTNLIQQSQVFSENSEGKRIRHYSHTQSFSNALLDVMQRDSNCQWESSLKEYYTLGAVVDFIYDDGTTDDMIKKVLLDRIDSFCITKEENGKEITQLDDRIDVLFEAIVTDERFEQKELPFELLNTMFKLSKKDVVIVKCNNESKSMEYERIMLDKGFITIDELSCHKFPKEIMDIIKCEYGEYCFGPQQINMYGVMIGNKYTTRDALVECFMKLGNDYSSYESLFPVILNSCFDEEIYKLLVYRLKQSSCYPFVDEFDIGYLNVIPVEQADEIKEDVDNMGDWFKECQICKKIFGCVEMHELVNEESIIEFLSQFGDKSWEYIEAYYRLLSFMPSKEHCHAPGK